MGLLSNKVDREQLKPGDHIYSWRQAYVYAHHGIYFGDGMVIHFTRAVEQEVGIGTILDRFIGSSIPRHDPNNPCPRCGDQTKKEGVISSCLDCFLYGDNLCLFEYGVSLAFFLANRGGTCTRAPSDPIEDVLHRAASFLLEDGFGGYDLFKENSEDFAIYCKTGMLICSGQAASNSAVADAAVDAAGAGVGAAAIFSATIRKMTIISPVSVLATVGYGTYSYCANRLASDIGRRHDAFKIPVESLIVSPGLNESKKTVEVPVTEAERRKKEEAERLAKLDEIAKKQRQREREVEEKERQRREALLGRGTEPASRRSEPPTRTPESGSAAPIAAAGPAPEKYVPRFKREKPDGPAAPPPETDPWTKSSSKPDGDRWRSDGRRPGGSGSSSTSSSSRNQRDHFVP